MSELPPSDGVVIEALATVPNERRAADVLRLALALAVLLLSLLGATLAHRGVRSTEGGLLDTIVTLPASLRDSLTAVAQLLAVVVPATVVVATAVRRRFATVGKVVAAGALGLLVGVFVSHLWLGSSHPSSWHELLTGRIGILAVTVPPVAWLAGTTAVVSAAGVELSGRGRRTLWWLTGIAAALEVIVGGFLPVDAAVAAAVGVSVGSSILLIFGQPARRPTAAQVVAALQECGVDVASLKQLSPAGKGPDIFRATTEEGIGLAVRVYAGDDRDRDRLARLTRWLLVRDPQDDRAGTTVESAAEHEMLSMAVAARAGGRVPEPVVAYPIAGRSGPPGALVAWIEVGGQALDLLSPDQVTDATLADLWQSVSRFHQHRLAHRQLRTGNVTIDGSERAWFTGLVVAELGATDRQLATDVAELLASLAVQIGVDRTVASAVAGLGAPTTVAAAAYLQPLAVSSRTWAAVRDYDHGRSVTLTRGLQRRGLRPGGRPSLYADLRTAVAQATGEPPVKLEPLSRFTWKKALTLLGAFAVIYLVLPQVANAGAAVRALHHANWWWVLAALPALFVAQAFSTLLQLGAMPANLPFGPTYAVSFGGSFLNRVTPNNVGGMALSFRYLQKAGVDSGAATGVGRPGIRHRHRCQPGAPGRLLRPGRSPHLRPFEFARPPVGAGAHHRSPGCGRIVRPHPPRPAFLSRQDLGIYPLGRDRHRRGGQEPAPPGAHLGGSPRRAHGTDRGPLAMRARPRRESALRPDRGYLSGGPPGGQRGPRTGWPRRPGGGPDRRAVRSRNARGCGRIRSAHLPAAYLLVDHSRRLGQPQNRRGARIRVNVTDDGPIRLSPVRITSSTRSG